MGPKSATDEDPLSSKHQLLPDGSSSVEDQEIMKGSSSSSDQTKRSIVSNEDGDYEPDSALIICENTLDYKNKKPIVYDTDFESQVQVAFSRDLMGSSTNSTLESEGTCDAQNSLDPDAMNYTSDHYDEYEDYNDDDDYEYHYDTDTIDNDHGYHLAAKFDNLDLPSGVEATVPWVQKIAPETPSNHVPLEDEVDKIYNSLKQFDTVNDYSDHYFANKSKEVKKPPQEWMKKIQQDWKLLENNLPETIFVRAYEERMDLLRAAIVGPAGTPYHDGLFFFDFQFPNEYPNAPPKAHYHSGGLRLNPNLYNCGMVCLSLLNTWTGSGCETWNSQTSTMLQVLVSIQALVLNEKPYFNEPGFEETANCADGQRRSLAYNEKTFLLSCKTMLYSLRKPPKHFEDFVAGHFRNRGNIILVACRAYLDNAQVGCDLEKRQNAANGEGCSRKFKAQLKQLFEDLLMEFTVKGADCREFLNQIAEIGDAAALPRAEDSTLED